MAGVGISFPDDVFETIEQMKRERSLEEGRDVERSEVVNELVEDGLAVEEAFDEYVPAGWAVHEPESRARRTFLRNAIRERVAREMSDE